MKQILWVLLSIILPLFPVSSAQAMEEASNPSEVEATETPTEQEIFSSSDPENLATTIQTAIQMLESEEYRPFLDRFIHPEDREKLLAKGLSMEDLTKGFSEEKAGLLLKALRSIQKGSPEVDEEEEFAVFEAEPRPIRFQKYAGQWYLRN